MAEHKGYEGKIKNVGAQLVEAPNKQAAVKHGATVHTGKDLRAGKKGKG